MNEVRPSLAETAPATAPDPAPDPAGILASLAAPVFVVDGEDHFAYVNPAAEQFFDAGASNLLKRPLTCALPEDSAIFALVRQVRQGAHSVAQTGVTVELPRGGPRFVSIEAAPLAEASDRVVVSLHERSIARKIVLAKRVKKGSGKSRWRFFGGRGKKG